MGRQSGRLATHPQLVKDGEPKRRVHRVGHTRKLEHGLERHEVGRALEQEREVDRRYIDVRALDVGREASEHGAENSAEARAEIEHLAGIDHGDGARSLECGAPVEGSGFQHVTEDERIQHALSQAVRQRVDQIQIRDEVE